MICSTCWRGLWECPCHRERQDPTGIQLAPNHRDCNSHPETQALPDSPPTVGTDKSSWPVPDGTSAPFVPHPPAEYLAPTATHNSALRSNGSCNCLAQTGRATWFLRALAAPTPDHIRRATEQIVRKEIHRAANSGRRINRAQARIIRSAAEIEILAADVEIQCLIELLIANVPSELQVVLADGLAEIVRPLESVADLGQLAFEIVADIEPARNIDERHSFAARPQSRGDSYTRIGRGREAVGRRNRFASLLHPRRMLRMQKRSLPFAEHREARLVHRWCGNCPRMTDIDLLNALVGQIAESWKISSARLEACERFR